jgi:hypothetical protein
MVGLLGGGLGFTGLMGQPLLADRHERLSEPLLLMRGQVRPELMGRDRAGVGR